MQADSYICHKCMQQVEGLPQLLQKKKNGEEGCYVTDICWIQVL